MNHGQICVPTYLAHYHPRSVYILVIQYLYSQYSAVQFAASSSPTAVIPAMDWIIMTDFSIPYKLVNDNSSPFNSHQFKITEDIQCCKQKLENLV